MTRDLVSVWACIDCTVPFANGETPPEMDEAETAAFVARIGATIGEHTHVAVGGAHELSCDNDGSTDCGCERLDFSWRACGTCGSTLGGERHAVTLFS